MDTLKVIIELAIFTVGIYLVLRFLRETRGSGVVRGLILVLLGGMIGFFTLIRTLELERLGMVFKEVTATIVLALVIVFHQEIRRAFVQLGDSQIFGRFFRREVKTLQRLLRSVARLSKERIGALIAIEREGSLANLAETGVHIDAELNSFLIESVFYPGTALHDGAIVIRGDRLVAASCLLPLSQNQDIDKRLGTRHRAAIGLTEESDALAIVVSEETGKISTSVGGKLDYGISLEQLERAIEEHQRGRTVSSAPKKRRAGASLLNAIFSDPYRKLIAVGLAAVLWVYIDGLVTHSEPITLTLRSSASDRAEVLDEGDPNALLVRTNDRRYSVQGFKSGSNALTSIEIRTIGTNSELADFGESRETIFVELDTKSLNNEKEQTIIRLEDLQIRPKRFAKLLERMEPREIGITLILNKEERVRLAYDNVHWGDKDLRLILEEVDFIPEGIVLRGPAAELDGFMRNEIKFRTNFRETTGSSGRLSGNLSLAVPADSNITMTPNFVTVYVAQEPDFQEFECELPVLPQEIGLTQEQRDSYTIAETVLVQLHAAGALASRLHRKDINWVQENLFVSVIIKPATLKSGGGNVAGLVSVRPREFRLGRDFMVEKDPLVEIKLKQQ